MIGYDGSDNSKRALTKAIELAKSSDSRLIIVVAVETAGHVAYAAGQSYEVFRNEMIAQAKNLLTEASDAATHAGIKVFASVEEGRPADTILARALEYKVDLIVVGSRGIRGVERLLMGSVSSAIVSRSQCDVLVVK